MKVASKEDSIQEICRKLDKLIAIELARSGLTRRDVAKYLHVSEKTIERMVPFSKIKNRGD